MASRVIYDCGCAECGDIFYPCEQHISSVRLESVGMEEVRVVDPVTGGEKGSKLARFDLIPPEALWALAEVYGRGARKYSDRNWEKGYAWGLSVAALQRHLSLWQMGESIDEETGAYHLAQVMWHAAALYTFEKRGRGTDDVRLFNNLLR